jgi:hypothetical protein
MVFFMEFPERPRKIFSALCRGSRFGGYGPSTATHYFVCDANDVAHTNCLGLIRERRDTAIDFRQFRIRCVIA